MVLASGSKQPWNAKFQVIKIDKVTVEAGGYLVRCISTQNIYDKNLYIIQVTLFSY